MSANPYTPEAMRARLDKLREDKAKREAVLEPLRAELKALVAETTEAERALRAKIKQASEGMYDLDVEIGTLAKALGGRSLSQERG